MPIADSDLDSKSPDRPLSPSRSIWRQRFSRAVPWIKRLVFLAVLIGLVAAAKQSVARWQIETNRLRTQANQLLRSAAEASDEPRRTELLSEADELERQIPSLTNLNWSHLVCSMLFYAGGLLPPCWILHRAVNASGLPCSMGRATAAQLLGHAGKYIPGKAMVVVLRVDAIARDRNESIRVGSSVFFETLLMMGVGGLLAGILLARSELPLWVRSVAVLMAVGSAIPVCPPLMRKLVSLLQKKGGDVPPTTHGLTWSLLASSAAASLVSWLLIGVSFAFLIAAIPSIESAPDLFSLFPVATSAIALGMVLGFASLLPGGAGVREYVTLLVLTPVIGPTHGLLAVIAARLMFILVESALAGLAWLSLRRQAPLDSQL